MGPRDEHRQQARGRSPTPRNGGGGGDVGSRRPGAGAGGGQGQHGGNASGGGGSGGGGVRNRRSSRPKKVIAPLYDLYLDLPHPDSSAGCDRARIIGAPQPSRTSRTEEGGGSEPQHHEEDPLSKQISAELYDGDNVVKISRYAFPDHDDQLKYSNLSFRSALHAARQQQVQQKQVAAREPQRRPGSSLGGSGHGLTRSGKGGGGGGVGGGSDLNRRDIYMQAFTHAHHHAFILRLNCGVRMHGHVRRYLPPHRHAGSRADVGRRGVRAMVILTRSPGGERFWRSVLNTFESLMVQWESTKFRLYAKPFHDGRGGMCPVENLLRELHGRYERIHRNPRIVNDRSTVTLRGVEFDMCLPDGGGDGSSQQSCSIEAVQFPLDMVRLHLPPTLQPPLYSFDWDRNAGMGGSASTSVTSVIDDMDSEMLPLLRCLGASHFLRLLSALLCERRVILISENLSRLSTCVRGAAALLAQGLLVWQHVYIPVLPPHLLKYLATPSPYLIGLLEPYTNNLEMIPGMGDVLCIDLDKNTIWTYNVPDPASSFPDLLTQASAGGGKKGKKDGGGMTDENGGGKDNVTLAENLAWILTKILKRDKKMWTKESPSAEMLAESGAGGAGGKGGQEPDRIRSGSPPPAVGPTGASPGNAKSGFGGGSNGIASITKNVVSGWGVFGGRKNAAGASSAATQNGSGTSPTQGGASDPSFHKESIYGALIREEAMEIKQDRMNATVHAAVSNIGASNDDASWGDGSEGMTRYRQAYMQYHNRDNGPQPQRHSGGGNACGGDESVSSSGRGRSRVASQLPDSAVDDTPVLNNEDNVHFFTEGENELGEESLRNSLVSFFLALFGDMGMYLSEANDGSLVLDRRKFLLLKKMQGDAEQTPMFKVLATLTKSDMFRQFVKMRIEELEREGAAADAHGERGKELYVQSLPLFSQCERHLLMKGMNVNNPNIPQVVKMIAESCNVHRRVVLAEKVRARTLTLTSKNRLFDDTFLYDLVSLAEECHDVNGVLPHVLGVVWTRMQGGRSTSWRCTWLSLHLLRCLLLHGPVTVIPEATDNIDLVRVLLSYSAGKNSESDLEVRELAACIYDLVLDRSTLFAQRRHCAGKKMMSSVRAQQNKIRWEDYLVKKLPRNVRFQRYHVLFRPKIPSKDRRRLAEQQKADQAKKRTERDGIGADGDIGGKGSSGNVGGGRGSTAENDLASMLANFNSTIANSSRQGATSPKPSGSRSPRPPPSRQQHQFNVVDSGKAVVPSSRQRPQEGPDSSKSGQNGVRSGRLRRASMGHTSPQPTSRSPMRDVEVTKSGPNQRNRSNSLPQASERKPKPKSLETMPQAR